MGLGLLQQAARAVARDRQLAARELQLQRRRTGARLDRRQAEGFRLHLARPLFAHAGDKAMGAADQQATARQSVQMGGLKAPTQLIGLGRIATDGPAHLQVRVLAHETLQLAAEGPLTALAHVVQQGNRRREPLTQGLP